MIDDARWQRAQAGELRFHQQPQWRDFARKLQLQYTALAGITSENVRGARVVDIGGGPESATLRLPVAAATVVDPLTFPDTDEQRYRAARVHRVFSAAEDFEPWAQWESWVPFDEVWCYNCLQHTRDPLLILSRLPRYASAAIRFFDWTGVPADEMHPHVLSDTMLRDALRATGWRADYELTGRWVTPDFQQGYYAAVWRPSP